MTSANDDARMPWASVAVAFIIAGAGLRLAGYFSQGQLYIDDARVALNIASRSFAALMQPLDYGQAAPIPFLWLEKLAIQIGGTNDLTFRIIPLLAGVAVVYLLWRVGRQALGDEPAVLATCLGALSAFLIQYAGAVKQYSSDALVTLCLVSLVLDVLGSGERRGAWRRLTIGGVIALWCAHPAVFVLAGAALALPADRAVRAAAHWQRRYAATLAAWLGTFALLYLLVYRAGERDPYLRGFWDWTFLTPGTADFGARAWRAARTLLVPPVWSGGPILGTPLVLGCLTGIAFAAGLLAILRTRGPSLAILVATPYLAVLGAAVIGQYPPADRFLLFAAPLLLFIYGAALWFGVRALPQRHRARGVAVALILLAVAEYSSALEEARHPSHRRETRTLLDILEARSPAAPVYFFTPRVSCACAPWVLYTTDWSAPDTARLGAFARNWAETRAGASATVSITSGRRQELIGTGARIPYVPIAQSPDPDREWVAGESARIRDVAHPMVWIWASEPFPESTIAALLHGIRQRGGRLIFAGRVMGATAWEIEFPNAGRR